MNKLFVMAIGLLLCGSIVSCKDNDLIPEKKMGSEQVASGKMRKETICGDFSVSLPESKALTLIDNGGAGGAQTGHPLIDWKTMFSSLQGRKIIMHCAIRNDAYDRSGEVGTDHLFYVDVPCEMKKSDDGYKLMFNEEIFQKYLQSKTLTAYTRSDNAWNIDDSNNNKWELQALCFMGNEPENLPSVDHPGEHDFFLEAQNVATGSGEHFSLSIPLYSDWTPVKLRMQGNIPRLSVSLALKPYGTMLALPINITSNLYYPFAVQCHLRSNAFTLKGAIKLGLLTPDYERTTMKGLPPVFEDVNQGKTENLDAKGMQQDGYVDYVFNCLDGKGNIFLSSKPDDNSEGQSMKQKFIYTWVFPHKKDASVQDQLTVKIGCGTVSPYCIDKNNAFQKKIYEEKSNDNGKMIYDAISSFHYAGDASAPSVFAEGKTLKLGKNPVKADIQSDMMISEVFHYEVRTWPNYYNYSMVEITNPTVNNLDLNNYKLVRERSVNTDRDHNDYVFASFQPGFNDRDDRAHSLPIDSAAIQDLYFDNVTIMDKSKTYITWQTSKDNPNPLPPVFSADMNSVYGDYPEINGFTKVKIKMTNRAKYYDVAEAFKDGNSPRNSLLHPGKSVVIMAGGYVNQNDNYTPLGVLSYYLRDAIKEADCQYGLYVENGVKELVAQRSSYGGVMDMGRQQVMILMKKKGKGFVPLDTSGPMYLYNKNKMGINPSQYFYMYKNAVEGSGTHKHQPFLLTRKDWVMKPTLTFNSVTAKPYGNTGYDSNTATWDDKGGWILTVSKADDNAAVASSVASPGSRFVNPDYSKGFPKPQSYNDDNVNIYGVMPR